MPDRVIGPGGYIDHQGRFHAPGAPLPDDVPAEHVEDLIRTGGTAEVAHPQPVKATKAVKVRGKAEAR